MTRVAEVERVTVEQVAKHLGVAKDSVYRWIESRGLPAHKIGRLWKFRLSEIDDVAYIRYASIFRNFKDLEEFTRELNSLVEERARRAELGSPT